MLLFFLLFSLYHLFPKKIAKFFYFINYYLIVQNTTFTNHCIKIQLILTHYHFLLEKIIIIVTLCPSLYLSLLLSKFVKFLSIPMIK